MKKYIISILCLFLFTSQSYAWFEISAPDLKLKIKNVKKIDKPEKDILKTRNKSKHDLKTVTIVSTGKYGKNYSFCDGKSAKFVGTFKRSNFSFSTGMDKADTTEAIFEECNFSYADGLPPTDKMIKCNTKTVDSLSASEREELKNIIDKMGE